MSAYLLIIENDDDFRGALSHLLRSKGYRVAEARSGREGLHLALETIPDLILLDLKLPDSDGSDIALHLRGESTTSNVPIIAVSGAADYRMSGGDQGGFCDRLQKPFPVSRLVAVIEQNLAVPMLVK